MGLYGVSKSAQERMTRILDIEVGGRGVSFNVMCVEARQPVKTPVHLVSDAGSLPVDTRTPLDIEIDELLLMSTGRSARRSERPYQWADEPPRVSSIVCAVRR